MFWSDDAKLMRRWADGDAPRSFVRVAVDAADTPVGVAIVTMGEDPFSHEPNAHLEVIVIAESADGHGLGRRLIDEVETESKSRGARTMSLHVVGNNHRARSVYRKIGYDEELIRSVKFLDS